ncbi:MAG: methanogenesis marker 17 protein [Candidatus Methanomethylophilaceae archaeon]|nr:methanogenesis marker 17 protein [Candidatus Methanomethylophilaceae archaeon]MDD3378624.1 methanogenesis marker 17 protein [Candidatus Methanomethylophilaceae archaeon]MDY0225142.1 methanogenesis marker 17 protein [Candidatus Methanomethylophilaceae archaeon]
MDIEVTCSEPFGADSYKALFEEIMSDIGKSDFMDKAELVLKPDIPLFIFSVKLKTEPTNMKISDVATVRSEGDSVFMTITDERHAPEMLDQLWKKYGRRAVEQQTRFDIIVRGVKDSEIRDMVIASGEEHMKEIVGAIWRSMPEGIKVRHTYIDGMVITVVATEERIEPYMLEEAKAVHKRMQGGAEDV